MRVLLSALALLLLYCSSSSAYDQQYQVGDTGPNGGIITDVGVTSTLIDTTVEVIGGMQETTEQWQYLETITEKVESVETTTVLEEITTQVLTEKTTDNTVCFGCDVLGTTSGGVTFVGDDAVRFNYQGGSISGTVALEDYLIKEEINRGFDISASADVMTCLNTIGSNTSCSDIGDPTADTFKITISVTDGVTNYTNTATHTIDWDPSSYQTVWGYLTVPQNNLSLDATATLELYGIDDGYWGGYYGPTVTNPNMTFTYNEASYITQLVETQVQQTITNYIQDELLTTEYIQEKIYIGDPTTDVPEISGPALATEDTPVVVDIRPISQDSFQVEIKVDTPAGETKTEMLEIKVSDMKIEKIESLDGEQDNEPNGPNEIRTAESGGPSEEVSVQEGNSQEVSSKENSSDNREGGNRGSRAPSYSPVMESIRIAVMATSQATQQFDTYRQVSLPTVEFYPPVTMDGGVNYDNPMGRYYSGASDALWNNMVNLQWQR